MSLIDGALGCLQYLQRGEMKHTQEEMKHTPNIFLI